MAVSRRSGKSAKSKLGSVSVQLGQLHKSKLMELEYKLGRLVGRRVYSYEVVCAALDFVLKEKRLEDLARAISPEPPDEGGQVGSKPKKT